jgi:integrase
MTYPREFREVSTAWIDTLRPPRFAAPIVEHTYVTQDEISQLARLTIPEDDLALRRDQAAAVLLYLSGIRVGALSSLPIEAVDLSQRAIRQWTTLGVRTKNSKSATTYLLPIPELMTVVEQWDALVRAQLPPTAIWCTPVISRWGEQTLSAGPAGANRHIAINKRFRKRHNCWRATFSRYTVRPLPPFAPPRAVLYIHLAGLHVYVADQQRAQLRGPQAGVQQGEDECSIPVC